MGGSGRREGGSSPHPTGASGDPLTPALQNSIPFAVVGSCEVVRDGGARPVRGRRYSWGTVEVENPHHCDFLNLRRMLVQTHLQDLKEVTHDLLYEGYRARCLQSLARPGARASRR